MVRSQVHCDLVFTVTLTALKGISLNLAQTSTWTQDQTDSILVVKGQGHCDLAKHVFGHNLRINTLIMTTFIILFSFSCLNSTCCWEWNVNDTESTTVQFNIKHTTHWEVNTIDEWEHCGLFLKYCDLEKGTLKSISWKIKSLVFPKQVSRRLWGFGCVNQTLL